MNVDEINANIPVPDSVFDRLDNIFMRQHDLMAKYHPIEQDNGFRTFKPPVDLHERHAQACLKDFAWRVTEELAEATEALQVHPDIPTHLWEELADAYHFLVELSILSGVTARDIADQLEAHPDFVEIADPVPEDKLHALFYRSAQYHHRSEQPHLNHLQFHAYSVVQVIGVAMNCLKQKPWKQTHMLTDEEKYRAYICEAHIAFVNLAHVAGLGHDEMYAIYFKKSEVNKFRQQSKY